MALAEEFTHEADALRASIAELSDELQQAKLETIENNILELTEPRESVLPGTKFRTTLRGLNGDDTKAFLRAQWCFLESGGAVVTPASGRDATSTLEAGGAGWKMIPWQGKRRDAPDIFECWCFVKDADGKMTKVTLRTTSLPFEHAAALRKEASGASKYYKDQSKAFEAHQQQYKDNAEGRSWLDTLLDYRELIKQHEVTSVASGVRESWDSQARGADGAEVTLGDERVVLGKSGQYMVGEAPAPGVELAARLLPFLAKERAVWGTFTAW